MMLEALATDDADIAYPFDIVDADGLLQLDGGAMAGSHEGLAVVPSAMWRALPWRSRSALVPMDEALRFHHGLSRERVAGPVR